MSFPCYCHIFPLLLPVLYISLISHFSLYFIICAVYLCRYIYSASVQPKFDIWIKLHKNNPNIPYLTFADDYINRAITKLAREINIFLITTVKFHQPINYHKIDCSVFNWCRKCVKTNISDILQIQNTGNIGSYLGCPNIQSRSREDFPRTRRKMDQKLASWKAFLLAADKIVLIRYNLTCMSQNSMNWLNNPNIFAMI